MIGDPYSALNINFNPDIYARTWTYYGKGGGTGIGRTLIKFIGLDGMPDSATILSAKLSLFGISSGAAAPQGNSTGFDNSAWLKRLTTDWNPDSVTWNNIPAETDINEANVSASTSVWNYDAPDIDVTNLVDDLLTDNNYGFVLEGQTEQIYRSLSFAAARLLTIPHGQNWLPFMKYSSGTLNKTPLLTRFSTGFFYFFHSVSISYFT